MVRGNKFKPLVTKTNAHSIQISTDQPATSTHEPAQPTSLSPLISVAVHTKQQRHKRSKVKRPGHEQSTNSAQGNSAVLVSDDGPASAVSAQAAAADHRKKHKRKRSDVPSTVPNHHPDNAKNDQLSAAPASKRFSGPAVGQQAKAGRHAKQLKRKRADDKGSKPDLPLEVIAKSAVTPQAVVRPVTAGRSRHTAPTVPHKKSDLHAQSTQADIRPTEAVPEKVPLPVSTVAPRKGEPGSSNWLTLKAALHQQQQLTPAQSTPFHRKRARRQQPSQAVPATGTAAKADNSELTDIVALDCEMVGVGPGGTRSALARVCVVNDHGHVLLDCWVQPGERVTDFRTHVSGVRPHHLHDAVAFAEARGKVVELTQGRTIVGHALGNDLGVLELEHSQKRIRDTACYPPLMWRLAEGRAPRSRGLRPLALEHLGLVIQAGEHSPVDDARAALYLYHRHRKEWEYRLSRGTLSQLQAPLKPGHENSAANTSARSGRSFSQLAANDDMVDL